MKRLALPIAALFLTQCSTELPPSDFGKDTKVALNPATDYKPASGEPSVDDIARYLAGRPVRNGEALARQQMTSTSYHKHALNYDYLWRKIAGKRTLRQEQYSYETIRPMIGNASTVIYPFGGPDVMYVTSMFPKASTYVLIGLESVGGVPDLSGDSSGLLNRLSIVMEEPLRHGYYITKEMRQAPAVTPIALTSLGLMGARVDSVQNISAGGRSALEIRYKAPRGGNKRLIYVSADLSNRGFNGGFQSWLGQYSGATGYFKAASYLPHDSNFSKVRDWMLANCKAIVQDDSGIPYRHYVSNNWEVNLLGTYRRPIPLFSEWRQDDLVAAYQAIGGRGPEVPFGSGYHLKVEDANLQVCKRK